MHLLFAASGNGAAEQRPEPRAPWFDGLEVIPTIVNLGDDAMTTYPGSSGGQIGI